MREVPPNLKFPPRAKFGEVLFMDLRPNDCRYPTKTLDARGEYLFCGAPVHVGAYCKEHHALCRNTVGPGRSTAFAGKPV